LGRSSARRGGARCCRPAPAYTGAPRAVTGPRASVSLFSIGSQTGSERRRVTSRATGHLIVVCLQASPSYVPVADSTTAMPLWAACCSKLLTLLSTLENWAGFKLPALILERRLS